MKELRGMAKRVLKEEDIELKLKLGGLPDDVDLDDLDVDLVSDDDEDVEGSDDDLDFGDDGGDEGGDDDMPDFSAMGGDDESPDDDDEDEEPTTQGMRYESDRSHKDDDEVVEIDENMLRRELARMRVAESNRRKMRLEAKRKGRKEDLDEMDASVLDDFGGGKVTKLPTKLSEADEDDLDEADDKAVKEESFRRLAVRLKRAERTVHEMKGQLAEMNLFNAKLLYANKLLQNEGMTGDQKLKVARSLDKATSLREVKVLYEALVGIDEQKPRRNLTEGTRRAGSASRASPVAPGRRLDESRELSRWGLLAGLSDEK
jgi:hypothetical protein